MLIRFGAACQTAGLQSSKTDRFVLLVYLGYGFTGVMTTVLGPLLPVLAGRWSLTDAQAGRLFTAEFAGSLAAVAVSGRLIARFGFSGVLAGALASMLAGVLGLWLPSFWTGLVSMLFCGVGCGLVIPASNLLVSERSPGRAAAALNILNFAWCLGAVAGPIAVGLLIPLGGLRLLLPSLAVPFGVLAAAAYAGKTNGRSQPAAGAAKGAGWPGPLAVATAVLLFLYVGAETALSGWIPSYIRRLPAGSDSLGAMGQSLFWAGILLGRLSAPLALRAVGSGALVWGGLGVNALGSTALLVAPGHPTLLAAIFAAGLGFSVVFPTAVAVFTERSGPRAAREAPYVFAAGGLGGAVVPWLVGCLSTQTGSLRLALLLPLLSTLAMMGVQRRISSLLAQPQISRIP